MMIEEPRSLTIWANNTFVALWYAFVFVGVFPKGLAFRFGTIWWGSSTVNLWGEHLSVFGTCKTLDFVRDMVLLSVPFVFGIFIVEVPQLLLGIRIWLFIVSCIAYVVSLVLRWQMTDFKTHRYNMCVEMLCHTVLPPVLGAAIFAPDRIEDSVVFAICFGVDIILKLGRTIFLLRFQEPRLPTEVPRCLSWAQAVSN